MILHTADVHGRVDRLPSLAAFLAAERRRAREAGALVLHVDAGDFFQGTPEGDLTQGRAVLDAFNEMGLDALAPGNHDFDLGPAVAEELARAARFPFLAANLRLAGGRGPPPWTRASLLLPELRVEILGLAPDTMERLSTARARQGLRFLPAGDALAEHAWSPGVARILVTHLGIDHDRALPLAGIAAVLGGHTHVKAVETLAGGTLLLHPGSHGTSVGRLELALDPATGAVRSARGEVIDVPPGRAPRSRTPATRAMEERVGTLVADLPRGGPEFDGISSPLGNLVADVACDAMGAEAAVILRSSIRGTLFAGPLRRRDLYEATPFPDPIVAVDVPGARLRRALERAVADGQRLLVEVSGIEMAYETDAPRGRRIRRLEVAGEPLDPGRAYRLATLSFMTEPGGLFAGASAPRDPGPTLYEAGADFFRARSPYRPPDFRPRIVKTP